MRKRKDGRPIIIVRKPKKIEEDHHGGSWKVAYADFVTAMMAFFLVMWIMGMDEGVRDRVQGYFNDPVGTERSLAAGPPFFAISEVLLPEHGSDLPPAGRLEQELQFQAIARAVETTLREETFQDLGVEIEIALTEEGLRIELMEGTQDDLFFARGAAEVRPVLRQLLQVIGADLRDLPYPIVIEGHTDSRPFAGGADYSNWELSVDRANAARRALMEVGLGTTSIREIRGHADQYLRKPDDPLAPQNRRVSLLFPFEPELESMSLTSPLEREEQS